MRLSRSFFNSALTAFFCLLAPVAVAQDGRADELLDRLADPELRNWDVTEREIIMLWSRSGSPSADYLLQRGRQAAEAGDVQTAFNHFSTLTDHAPDFAEGWNARATILFQTQRFGPAISDIQRVLALEPRHFGAMTGLGIMLEEMEQYEQALEVFRQAQSIHPHRPEVRDAIARIEQRLEGQAL